jgi:hypothetical protein
MPYRVRGLEDQELWVVYATNRATADRIAELFRTVGYANVEVQEMPET